jgi:hypothetical protein
VTLGRNPEAHIYRRFDWGWAVYNRNVVCCSLDREGRDPFEAPEDEELVDGDDERPANLRHPQLFAMLTADALRERNRQRNLAYNIYMNAHHGINLGN